MSGSKSFLVFPKTKSLAPTKPIVSYNHFGVCRAPPPPGSQGLPSTHQALFARHCSLQLLDLTSKRKLQGTKKWCPRNPNRPDNQHQGSSHHLWGCICRIPKLSSRNPLCAGAGHGARWDKQSEVQAAHAWHMPSTACPIPLRCGKNKATSFQSTHCVAHPPQTRRHTPSSCGRRRPVRNSKPFVTEAPGVVNARSTFIVARGMVLETAAPTISVPYEPTHQSVSFDAHTSTLLVIRRLCHGDCGTPLSSSVSFSA